MLSPAGVGMELVVRRSEQDGRGARSYVNELCD